MGYRRPCSVVAHAKLTSCTSGCAVQPLSTIPRDYSLVGFVTDIYEILHTLLPTQLVISTITDPFSLACLRVAMCAMSHDAAFYELQQKLPFLLLQTLEVCNSCGQQDQMLPGILRMCLHPVLQLIGGSHKECLQGSSAPCAWAWLLSNSSCARLWWCNLTALDYNRLCTMTAHMPACARDRNKVENSWVCISTDEGPRRMANLDVVVHKILV